jgi:hypothetical protein
MCTMNELYEYDLASEQEAELENRIIEANKYYWKHLSAENNFGWEGAYADQIEGKFDY